ncbi:MAG: hypothetical protein V9G04_04250 [Nocardioides sp.]|jgi:hypothetical protein
MDAALEAQLAAARAELHNTMAHARAALDAAKVRLAPTREETEELQRQARSGELGEDMRELARHIDAGRTSWAEVFDGSSPYAELIRDHMTRMGEEHGEAARRAIEEDDDFDPDATSPGV